MTTGDFIIMELSSGEIVNFNATYPRADYGPIIGGDPNLVYLKKYTPFAKPVFDSRIFKDVQTDSVTELPHPELTQFKQYRTEFSLVRRDNAEIIESIDREESNIKSDFLNNPDVAEVMLIMLTALWNKTKGISLTILETAAVNDLLGLNVTLLQNKDVKEIKKAQVLNNETPDLDNGWTKKTV